MLDVWTGRTECAANLDTSGAITPAEQQATPGTSGPLEQSEPSHDNWGRNVKNSAQRVADVLGEAHVLQLLAAAASQQGTSTSALLTRSPRPARDRTRCNALELSDTEEEVRQSSVDNDCDSIAETPR